MKQKVTFNTIDLDTNEKEKVFNIVHKILKCKQIAKFNLVQSERKGFHISLWCYHNCDLCRLVFDDPVRYYFDGFRPIRSRNVLFSEKIPVKKSLLHIGVNTLAKIGLKYLDIKEKESRKGSIGIF